MAERKRIFVAGPMFSQADQYWQEQIDRALKAKPFEFDTYLAHRDGFEMQGLIETMLDPNLQSWLLYQASLMVQHIGWCLEVCEVLACDALVLNMNGRVPDEGAVMEATLAWAACKPVVNYKDSSITMWGLFDNPMVAGLDVDWQPIRSLPELAGAVNEALQAAPAPSECAYTPPPAIEEARKLGEFVKLNKSGLRTALLGFVNTDITKSLAALAPDLKAPANLASVWQFVRDVLAGTLTPPTVVPPPTVGPHWPPMLPRP